MKICTKNLNLFICFFIMAIFGNCQEYIINFKLNANFNSSLHTNKWRAEITKGNSYILDTTSVMGRFQDGFLISIMSPTGAYSTAKRSEYVIKLYDSIGDRKFLSFSFKLPNSFKYDQRNLGRETMICQWHSKPAPGKNWDYYRKYNKYNRPSVALYITTNNNRDFYLVLRYGNNGKEEFEATGNLWRTIAVSKITTNKWYDLMFEIKWSLKNDGYISSWLDGQPLTRFNGLHNRVYGANMHNESPAYFKFGQYRYFDDTHHHQIYFDELRVGDKYSDVVITPILDKYSKLIKKTKFIKNHK